MDSVEDIEMTEYYTRSRSLKIDDLPVELMEMIFSYLPQEDLFNNVRNVSKHWSSLATSSKLWTHIRVGPEVTTEQLIKWLEIAPHLQGLTAVERSDGGIILQKVSKYNKKIKSIQLRHCWGSYRNQNLPSLPLCNLLFRCPKLSYIYLSGCKIISCKFFKLLGGADDKLFERRRRDKSVDRLMYIGPISLKQLRVYVNAKRESRTQKLAILHMNPEGILAKFDETLDEDPNIDEANVDVDRILEHFPGF